MKIEGIRIPFPAFKQPKGWEGVRKLQKTPQEQEGGKAHVLEEWDALSRLRGVQLARGAGLKPRQGVVVEALKVVGWEGLRKLATNQAGRVGANANPHS